MTKRTPGALGTLLVLLLAGVAAAEEAGTAGPGVGDALPDFELMGTDGETYSPASLAGKKSLVLVFYRGYW